MILDTLKNAPLYYAVHPRFAQAFAFVQEADLSTLVPGRNEIDGEELFVMNNSGEGGGHNSGPLEVHRQYIDIHVTLEGTDEIGWKPLDTCTQTQVAYQEDGDYALFDDDSDFFSVLPPGTFAIYFPQDAHATTSGKGEFRKLVLKVLI